ncbi:MAG: hypothetical protein OSB12_00785, partial [Planctomycetota bacterium]|nr:hypothetical protein [Planctomycetota bacterium]
VTDWTRDGLRQGTDCGNGSCYPEDMVYFGPRNQHSRRQGLSLQDKIRVVGPALLLVALSVVVIFPRWTGDDQVTDTVGVIPLRNPQQSVTDDASTAPTEDTVGTTNVPDAVAITPIEDLPPMTAPFMVEPSRLTAVRDAEAITPGQAELDGQIYLLHRWRAEHPVPSAGEAPRVDEIGLDPASIRGHRCHLVLTLIEHPQLRTLEPNASGLKRYWEVFGSDGDGHLHRVDFIEKPKNLPSGTDVYMEGDFLRLYRYQAMRGVEGMVPQWVAGTLTRYQSPFAGGGDQFTPLSIIAAISIGTLFLLLGIQFWMGRSKRKPRTQRGRR